MSQASIVCEMSIGQYAIDQATLVAVDLVSAQILHEALASDAEKQTDVLDTLFAHLKGGISPSVVLGALNTLAGNLNLAKFYVARQD